MLEYREAGPGDANDVAQLHARSWRESYRGVYSDAFLDGDLPGERLAVWRDRLAAPPRNQLVLLALDGTELLGFVCVYGAHEAPWGSLVDNLHVARETKRSGIGTSLMRQAGAWLVREHPGLGVYLFVLEANAPARRFYERLGARNAEVLVMEAGGAVVRSCRYTWARSEELAGGGRDASLW